MMEVLMVKNFFHPTRIVIMMVCIILGLVNKPLFMELNFFFFIFFTGSHGIHFQKQLNGGTNSHVSNHGDHYLVDPNDYYYNDSEGGLLNEHGICNDKCSH